MSVPILATTMPTTMTTVTTTGSEWPTATATTKKRLAALLFMIITDTEECVYLPLDVQALLVQVQLQSRSPEARPPRCAWTVHV